MKKSLFFAGVALLLFSCNSSNSANSEGESGGTTSMSKANAEVYDCLQDFSKAYELLLTKDEINSVYPVDFTQTEETLRSGSFGEYSYRWPSDRPNIDLVVSGMEFSSPDHNLIGVKGLSFSSDKLDFKSIRETFDMAYKELSEEELAKIQENLDKQNKEIKEAGKGFMEARARTSWDFVEGVGSSAWYKWNEDYGAQLAVLAGRAKFNIEIKISNDPEENRVLAKKLAEKVLAKCE